METGDLCSTRITFYQQCGVGTGADREPPPQELGGKEADPPRVNLAQPLMDQRAVEQH